MRQYALSKGFEWSYDPGSSNVFIGKASFSKLARLYMINLSLDEVTELNVTSSDTGHRLVFVKTTSGDFWAHTETGEALGRLIITDD